MIIRLHTQVGLQSLFYIQFVITFFNRVMEEVMRHTKKHFKRFYTLERI